MNLFTYGSLMCEEIMLCVTGVSCRSQEALLHDHIRRAIRGETYPAIIPYPGGCVRGRLYWEVPPKAFARLDRFEGEMYERREVVVEPLPLLNCPPTRAQVYVLSDRYRDWLDNIDWSFEEFLRTGKKSFLKGYPGFKRVASPGRFGQEASRT
ncbi:MAG: gamma-glutamylcyclotransferase [Kiritimatiellae bacterium]|nr:gamma-glutamylcyclotransferase [Kiritimatiellia bacterium]